MNAVFLDRDGTINVGTPTYERVDSLEKVRLLPNTIEALNILAKLDFGVFFITNQAGLAEKLITHEQFQQINNKVLELISSTGVNVLKTYVCPHGENDSCDCRKPKPKLLIDASREYEIDLTNSWMIGDRASDVMTGFSAGTKTILVKTGVPNVESDKATSTAPTLLEAIEYIRDN